ncbi:MAG: hypothetical protein MRY57_02740 [Candidatus Pacebacteria bacterium]|nr:hypothetical protein [Candidatus Paceibacterota bacterium]
MIKNVAYVIVFIIFAVITTMALTIDKAEQASTESPYTEQGEARYPEYTDASAESVFKGELGI